MRLSVVIPCYNEVEVLPELRRRLTPVLEGLKDLDFEVIYVDDGSRDETPEMLEKIYREDERSKVIRLSRNFGHQAAITAGLEHAAGDAVVVMDADLQDPPEVIPEMVEKWRGGSDVAYGVRTARQGERPFKLMSARLFYRLLGFLSDTRIPLDTGDFRLMDRRVVDAFISLPERHRFIRGMVSWVGFDQIPVPYTREPRAAGATKYPLSKMIRFALDALISFSFLPLRFVSWLGLAASLIAVVGIIWAVVVRLTTNNWVAGWATTFIAVLFVGGVQLLALGMIGEYIGRVYGEVKARPLYIVRDRIGFDSRKD